MFIFGFIMGVITIFVINFLLQSKWHLRTVAVFGLLLWPLMSVVWLIKRCQGKVGLKDGNRPSNSIGRIWFQLRTNTSYVLRGES